MFTPDDRRLLRAIARSLPPIAQKLDLNLELSIADLRQETTNMTTVAQINEKMAKLQTSVQANTDATASIAAYVAGLKAQLTDLAAQLAEAIAAGADPAALQAISDNIDAVTNAIDADAVAEAALVNTPAEPA